MIVYARKRRLIPRARQVATSGWCWCFGHEWTEPVPDDGVISERCVNGCGAQRLVWYHLELPCECVPVGAAIGDSFVVVASCPAHGEFSEG